MTYLEPTPSPERENSKELLDDNARKFIVTSLDSEVLGSAHKYYLLITDWLEMATDHEKKLAYKKFPDGNVEILLITKVTSADGRKSEKPSISQEEYEQLLAESIRHVEKVRYEIAYVQGDREFDLKYDEFTDSDTRILEVDAKSKTDQDRASFDPTSFPGDLIEVTGDTRYYGYRIGDVLQDHPA